MFLLTAQPLVKIFWDPEVHSIHHFKSPGQALTGPRVKKPLPKNKCHHERFFLVLLRYAERIPRNTMRGSQDIGYKNTPLLCSKINLTAPSVDRIL